MKARAGGLRAALAGLLLLGASPSLPGHHSAAATFTWIARFPSRERSRSFIFAIPTRSCWSRSRTRTTGSTPVGGGMGRSYTFVPRRHRPGYTLQPGDTAGPRQGWFVFRLIEKCLP